MGAGIQPIKAIRKKIWAFVVQENVSVIDVPDSVSWPRLNATATTVDTASRIITILISLSSREYFPISSMSILTMITIAKTHWVDRVILKTKANKPAVTAVTAAWMANMVSRVSRANNQSAHFPSLA